MKKFQEKRNISIGILPSLAAHYISKCKDVLGDGFEVEWKIEHTKVLMGLFKERKIEAMFIDSVVERCYVYKRNTRRKNCVCRFK